MPVKRKTGPIPPPGYPRDHAAPRRMRDVESRALAGPLPALPASPTGAPPRLRDLVQRRRGQHHLLRHPRPRTPSGRGPPRPARTSVSSSSCRNRSLTRAASPTPAGRSARSWPRSSPSGPALTRSGSSCRPRSAPAISARWPASSACSRAATATRSRSGIARSSRTRTPRSNWSAHSRRPPPNG